MDNSKDSLSIERYQFRGYDFMMLLAALTVAVLWIFDILLIVNGIEDPTEYIKTFGTGFQLLYICSFIILPIIIKIDIFITIIIIFNIRSFLNSKIYSYSIISNIPFYLKTNKEDQKLVVQMFLDRLANFKTQGSVEATESQKLYLNFYLKQVKIKNIIIYSSVIVMLTIMLIHGIMELTMNEFSILYLVISSCILFALPIQIKNFIDFLIHYYQLKNTLFYYKCEEEEQV